MRSRWLAGLLPLVFAISLVGCVTAPPAYQFTPSMGGDLVWNAGRPSLRREIDGVRVSVVSAGQSGETVRLQVEIANGTLERFDVSPADVTFTACSGTVNASCAPTANVTDPESELVKVERREREERTSANAREGVMAFLLILSVAADVGSVASGHANRDTGLGTAAMADAMDSSATSSDRAMARLEDEKDFWANGALRRNTIEAGQSATGQVVVPIYPKASYLWLHVKVGARCFSFRFDQLRVLPAV